MEKQEQPTHIPPSKFFHYQGDSHIDTFKVTEKPFLLDERWKKLIRNNKAIVQLAIGDIVQG